jgi:hypothetical protein
LFLFFLCFPPPQYDRAAMFLCFSPPQYDRAALFFLSFLSFFSTARSCHHAGPVILYHYTTLPHPDATPEGEVRGNHYTTLPPSQPTWLSSSQSCVLLIKGHLTTTLTTHLTITLTVLCTFN